MNRIGLSIAVLFILALALYIPSWMSQTPEEDETNTNSELTPSYLAKNITTSIYDEDGNLSHKVFAKHMEHYDLLGFMIFEQPSYTMFSDNSTSPWQLTANEGTLYDNNLIHLESSVTVANNDKNSFVQSIHSEFIELNLDTKMATTDQLLTIKGADFLVYGNGFKANLNTKQYELNQHVKTIYTPSN